MIGNATANNDPVMANDVCDATTDSVVVQRTVCRGGFRQAGDGEFFRLPYQNPRHDHQPEFQVYWQGNAFLNVERVLGNDGIFIKSRRSNDGEIGHVISRFEDTRRF
ncbi:hypothetical protein [Streptomyces sp. ISL-100]|uniref:hypothetical protein n=1 Tax=Streptomyces sp. ISL-100 TaxID=2819173 RepID=UPI001BE6528D|nr:hypothetical protein [Streptomyces sp. ISL-100]MBT2395386.1 hypothetical protein [Streptomyces sp. ISL-100]